MLKINNKGAREMKLVIDTHVHTQECRHAYCTIDEIVREASRKNLELICLTEHGPMIPGAPDYLYFLNMRVVPPKLFGVEIIKGIEANIVDFEGNLDIHPFIEDRLEYVIAGLHTPVLKPGTIEENTQAILGAIENPLVDCIAHIGNPKYPLNYEPIYSALKENDTLIEINNSSFYLRDGSTENCLNVVSKCKELEIPIVVSSDSHFYTDVGNFTYAKKALEIVDFPEELVLNTSAEKFKDYLLKKGKVFGKDPRNNGVEYFKSLGYDIEL
jgi:putative hydrolase